MKTNQHSQVKATFEGFEHAAGMARETGRTVYASAAKTMMGHNMRQVPKLAYKPWKLGAQWVVAPSGKCVFVEGRRA